MNRRDTGARTDAFTFYAIATISFLESAIAHYVEGLRPYFGDSPEAWSWLSGTWQAEEAAHGRVTRRFVESRWPEFDWAAGHAEFLASYAPRCSHERLRPSRALEALSRCVTETEAAMVYRCLADYTADPELKAMLQQMSRDEIRHYAYFRELFDRNEARERNSFWRKLRTVLARNEVVQGEDFPLAFAPLNGAWRAPMPFAPLTYAAFSRRAAQVMSGHFPIEAASRMMFRPLRSGRAWESVVLAALRFLVKRQYSIQA